MRIGNFTQLSVLFSFISIFELQSTILIYLLLTSNRSVNSAVLPRVAPDGRLVIPRMGLSDMPVQQKFHCKSFLADRTPVEASGVAGQVKLQLEFRVAADAAEDATRCGTACDARRRGGTPR